MLNRVYSWMLNLASHKYALFALAFIAFVESSIFPIPPDIILIPMILAAKNRAWLIAGICTFASVLGGIFGYGIGFYMFDQIGRPILDFYNHGIKFTEFKESYNNWGSWAVFFAGITPFPYKVITILSGVTELNLPIFIFSSILARGVRFYIIAALLWKYGSPIQAFIERRLGLLFIIGMFLLLGGFVLIKILL